VPKYDKAVSDFAKQFGEEAVETALNAYVKARQRSKEYATERSEKNKKVTLLLQKAKDPAIAAKLRELGIQL
jgi:hypothetical protein